MMSRIVGWLSLAVAAVAISAAITAMAFGGDLSSYVSAPYCVNGQHSSTTECREVYQTAVAQAHQGSPCTAAFTNGNTTSMDCNQVWSALRPHALATLELWHGEVVGVADQAGISRTDLYPQDTGRLFLTLAIVLGFVALIFAGVFYKIRLAARNVARQS